MTEQADAASNQSVLIETMQSKVDSSNKQLAHFQELYVEMGNETVSCSSLPRPRVCVCAGALHQCPSTRVIDFWVMPC